jgi:hypothetical protein
VTRAGTTTPFLAVLLNCSEAGHYNGNFVYAGAGTKGENRQRSVSIDTTTSVVRLGVQTLTACRVPWRRYFCIAIDLDVPRRSATCPSPWTWFSAVCASVETRTYSAARLCLVTAASLMRMRKSTHLCLGSGRRCLRPKLRVFSIPFFRGFLHRGLGPVLDPSAGTERRIACRRAASFWSAGRWDGPARAPHHM